MLMRHSMTQELLLLIRTFKRASVRSVTAIVPYFGYGRQDRKTLPRVPVVFSSNILISDLRLRRCDVTGGRRVGSAACR